MFFQLLQLPQDSNTIKDVIQASFSETPDAKIDQWLSFSYMEQMINQNRALGFVANISADIVTGMIYTQQENPVNGIEGEEKWVISVLAVLPEYTSKGLGSRLIREVEKTLKDKNVKKLFTFTNEKDEKVIHFYEKNGFTKAGIIKNYQYGVENNACFLMKYL